MFSRKNQANLYSVMIGAILIGSVALVVTVLVEAVLGMHSYF